MSVDSNRLVEAGNDKKKPERYDPMTGWITMCTDA
jgi:hypothetical protein